MQTQMTPITQEPQFVEAWENLDAARDAFNDCKAEEGSPEFETFAQAHLAAQTGLFDTIDALAAQRVAAALAV